MTHSHNKKFDETRRGLVGRLAAKLGTTRDAFGRGLGDLLLGKRELDDTLIEELEALLLTAKAQISIGQVETARELLHKAIEIDGDFAAQSRQLLEALARQQDYPLRQF